MITVREIVVNGITLSVAKIVNSSGASVELLNLGATVKSLFVPDRNGMLRNVVLGYDETERYLANTHYYGSTIGRYANRISDSSFSLNGKAYRLQSNDTPNSNHGGNDGFHTRIFDIARIAEENGTVTMRYRSPDGEAGFPGQVELNVAYSWSDDNELAIRYTAEVSGRSTPLNITNHSYFNLSGDCTSDATQAELTLHGESILETTDRFIPTGRIIDIRRTPFDFTSPHKIADRIGRLGNRPLKGYNDYYITGGRSSPAAKLYDRRSGIAMRMYTDYPGVLFYSGDCLPRPYAGVCLEGQLYVNAPNRPEFPSAILHPGTRYDRLLKYHFTVE